MDGSITDPTLYAVFETAIFGLFDADKRFLLASFSGLFEAGIALNIVFTALVSIGEISSLMFYRLLFRKPYIKIRSEWTDSSDGLSREDFQAKWAISALVKPVVQ